MSSSSSYFIEEDEKLYAACSRANVALFRFFDMFLFDISDSSSSAMATVRFGKSYEDDEVPKDVAKQLRSFIKEQKRMIRENPRCSNSKEGRKKMYSLITLLLQYGIFSPAHQGKIMTYAVFTYSETTEKEDEDDA